MLRLMSMRHLAVGLGLVLTISACGGGGAQDARWWLTRAPTPDQQSLSVMVSETACASAASAAVLITALALVACSANTSEPSGSSPSSSTSATASQAAIVVKLNGVAVTLPEGWFEAAPTLRGPVAANSVTRYPKPMPVALPQADLAVPASASSMSVGYASNGSADADFEVCGGDHRDPLCSPRTASHVRT